MSARAGRGGQANLGNARILRAFGTSTPPLLLAAIGYPLYTLFKIDTFPIQIHGSRWCCLTCIFSIHESTFQCVYKLPAATFIPLEKSRLEWECIEVKFCEKDGIWKA